MKISIKSAKRGQKKAKLCPWHCYSFVKKIWITRISLEFFSKFEYVLSGFVLEPITDASLNFHDLWYCTLWLQWCHSLHTDPSGAFCTKFSPIHSCTYDQNHKDPSTSSTSLSRIYRRDSDLSASVELAYCSQHTRPTECTPISSDYKKKVFRVSHPSYFTNIRNSERRRRSDIAFIEKFLKCVTQQNWNRPS